MTLRNDAELANTREKLRDLEERYEQLRHDPAEDSRVRERTLFSLKRVINQLKEEVARYQTRQPAGQ